MWLFIKKIKYYFFLSIIFSFIILFLFKYDLQYHQKDSFFTFQNFNGQGMECHDNRLYITENNGDIFEFNNKKIKKIASLYFPNKKTEKERFLLATPTSIEFLNDHIALSANSLSLLPPKLSKFDYAKLFQQGHLTDDIILEIIVKNEFKGIRIEKINFLEHDYLALAGKINKKNFIEILNLESLLPICRASFVDNLQNLYWNGKTNHLYAIRNIIKNRGGRISIFDLKNSNTENLCPFEFKKINDTIILTTMELESFTYCNGREYYLYFKKNNSILVKKII